MEKQIKLGTHNGPFHADEVFATVFLLRLYPDAEIIRSREQEMLNTCDIVYDVGRGKYDHHSLDKEYRDNGIPYAASGLIWRDFGRGVLEKEGVTDAALVDEFFHEIDQFFIQPLDALDNGFGIEKSLPILDLASIVRLMNPSWDSSDSEEECFQKAICLAKTVFARYLDKILASQRAFPLVQRAFEQRQSPELLILETGCPWEKALMQLDEKEEVLYVISGRNNGQYTIQAVPDGLEFSLRKSFPEAWAGLEGMALEKVTNVPDSIFCHSGLWLAVAGSREAAIQLAKLAVEE